MARSGIRINMHVDRMPLATVADVADEERQLRELRPTASNLDELRALMDRTPLSRRQWIRNERPDGTTILKRWPRLFDVNECVSFVMCETLPIALDVINLGGYLRFVFFSKSVTKHHF